MCAGFYEEGDKCPECHKGNFEFSPIENCSCHINPPCSAYTDRYLLCSVCGFKPDESEFKDVPITYGLSTREYKPKPLDNTKIDYRSKMNIASSMIKEGVYPEGTSMEEVRKIVDGTFGGRFEYFGGGKIKYIAYTD